MGSARSGGPLSARAAGARGAETGSRSTHGGAGGAVRYIMLVVDDSHMNRKMILKALLKEGHVCEEAEDGLQAIAKVLEKQTTPSTLYDGILMDFVMPNMDGPTATKALRAMGYNGVILGVTGNQLSFDIEHFVECGANKVLMKPLKMDEFRQSMELGNVNTTSGQNTRAQKKKRASVSKGQNAAVLGEDEVVEQAAVSYEVLIVDDSGTNRKMLRRMMTSAGHQCDEAEDGLQAIMKAKQKIEQSGLSKRSYDVVLMDYVMPNMDGPTTTKALRAMGYEGVVIGITGNNVDFDHFMNCGANRVIEKPLKIEMFVDVMDTFDKKQRQEKAKRAGIAEDDGSGPGSIVATSRCGRRHRGLSVRHVAVFKCTCHRPPMHLPASPSPLLYPTSPHLTDSAGETPAGSAAAAAVATSRTSSTPTTRRSSSSRSPPCWRRCSSRWRWASPRRPGRTGCVGSSRCAWQASSNAAAKARPRRAACTAG